MVEKNWKNIFKWGTYIKLFHGCVEFISGFVVLLLGKHVLSPLILHFSRAEILEDPHDLLINFLTRTLQNTSYGTFIFAVIYITVSGLLNILLSLGLLHKKQPFYIAAFIITSLLVLYQIHRFTITHGIGLMVLTVYDICFMYIVWHEYKINFYEKNITS